MKVQLYSKESEHHKKWLQAFADGLKKHGVEYEGVSGHGLQPVDADLHVFWSMHHPALLKHCREKKQPFICLERGYIDRLNFTSINLNGLNGRSQLCLEDMQNNTERRIKHSWYITPRSNEGNNLIVMGQVPGDASLEGQDIHLWAAKTLKYFSHRGFSSFFKPHPLDNQRPENVGAFQGHPIFEGDMKDALNDANMIVTYSSNAGVDAWMNGVPALAESPVSMLYKWQTAKGLCLGLNHWLNDLSFRQYNEEEITKGDTWQIIKDRILPPS